MGLESLESLIEEQWETLEEVDPELADAVLFFRERQKTLQQLFKEDCPEYLKSLQAARAVLERSKTRYREKP